MSKMTFIKGDVTSPIGVGNKIIVHITNNVGKWGSGVVVDISRKWKAPEQHFRRMKMRLGQIGIIQVEPDIWVGNMCAQDGIKGTYGPRKQYVNYSHLETCLMKIVAEIIKMDNVTIHMPRIGCGRGGGNWNEVEPIIRKTLINNGFEVFVYDK